MVLALMLVGGGVSAACTPEDPVDWAETACAEFDREVSGDLDSRSLPEPSRIGDIRAMLVEAGASVPPEWKDLDDDDLVAECVYNMAAGAPEDDLVYCPGGTRQASFLVDEAGHGVFSGSTCR